MNDLIEFLKRDNIQQLLYEERLEEVYKEWYNDSILTKFFIENGINPLEYVNTVFPYMFKEVDLKHIVIPNSVTSIGKWAFYDCNGLTSVTIGNSVTSIGDYAFRDCSSLISLRIPDSVTSIRNYAFYGCKNLTSITIPNSVTSIGYGAFIYCSSLKSITIPDSVTSIGESAFKYCDSLLVNCKMNSYTHKYCEENGINYKAT